MTDDNLTSAESDGEKLPPLLSFCLPAPPLVEVIIGGFFYTPETETESENDGR